MARETSRLVWARGLKLVPGNFPVAGLLSRLVWARGLKLKPPMIRSLAARRASCGRVG